jgi:hypothetical protein
MRNGLIAYSLMWQVNTTASLTSTHQFTAATVGSWALNRVLEKFWLDPISSFPYPSIWTWRLYLRVEVTTAMTMKNALLCDVTPCGSCKNLHFVGTCPPYYHNEKKQRARNNVSSNYQSVLTRATRRHVRSDGMLLKIRCPFSYTSRSRKLRLTAVGDPPRWPRDTHLSTKVGTKFCRQVAVDQSV